jgi:hypothetical protein
MYWKGKTIWFMENGSAIMLSMSERSDIKGKQNVLSLETAQKMSKHFSGIKAPSH